MANIRGCDIASPYQDSWKPSSAYDFVFVKASQNTGYKNPKSGEKLKLARNAGMVVGHYHWMGTGSLTAQLNNFVAAADVKDGELIAIDWEQSGVSCANKDKFIKMVKAKFPKNKVGLYCNTNYWLNIDTTGYYGDFLWIAWYSSKKPNIQTPWTFWQYSQSGGLDKNEAAFSSKADLKKWAGGAEVANAVSQTVDGIALGDYKTSGTKILWRSLYHNNNVGTKYTCYCVTQAIAVAEAKLKKLGVIKECLDFWQFGYGSGAAASAATHAAGGVVDVVQTDDVTLKTLREVGFTAAWYRGPGAKYGNFSTKHIHAVLSGCPHASAQAKAQVTAVKNGKNGLANNGADYGPKVAYTTYKTAFKKFVEDITNVVQNNVPNSDKDDFDMSKFSRMTRSKDQIFKKGKVKVVYLDDKNNITFKFGGGNVFATFRFAFSNLKPQDDLQVQPYYVETDSKGNYVKNSKGKVVYHTLPVVGLSGTAGKTFDQMVVDFKLPNPPKGHTYRMRLRAGFYGEGSVKVTSVNTTIRES